MPFRPCTDKERSVLEERIKAVEEEIAERTRHLLRIKAGLDDGVWFEDHSAPREEAAR